ESGAAALVTHPFSARAGARRATTSARTQTGRTRMTRTGVWTTFAGWGVAVALSAFACGGGDTKTANKFPAGDATNAGEPAAGRAGSTAATEKSPVTITGCLQKGEARSDYILTDVNATPSPAGTSGSTSSTDAVGKEQMRLAKRAYSLSGDRDTLEPLVGKQV